uniref:Uncharacterized protein n=1 Tax=Aegilops tauschii subsp. strangulata TaxID=200361 RepID=A0A452XGK7_AEGTS
MVCSHCSYHFSFFAVNITIFLSMRNSFFCEKKEHWICFVTTTLTPYREKEQH